MEVPSIVQECSRLGVTALGITDHLNSLDMLDIHRSIKRDIQSLVPEIDVYFGMELNFIAPDGGFPFSPEVKEQYGFQFAMGGIHRTYLEAYDLKKIVDIQHRHHLKTCRDPLVDVLVHPYSLNKGEFDKKGWPWIASLPPIPESYARELGQTAKETNTAIELNGNMLNHPCNERYRQEYIAFLSVVAAEGCCFSFGSDAHGIGSLQNIRGVWQVAEQLALTADRIWRPKCQPMKGACRGMNEQPTSRVETEKHLGMEP